jgi:hypothetical protein
MASQSKARQEIRQAKLKDVLAIGELVRRAYDDLPAYTQGEIRGQINNYPEGCFVALFDGAVVGYCASIRGWTPKVTALALRGKRKTWLANSHRPRSSLTRW